MSASNELDRLLVAFRDNPRSAVFVPLAQGYLRMGRPAEAIDVLAQGLVSHPDHGEALIALGSAYMMLHRWRDAEVELVKAVKIDRYSQRGFAMLGEILARRGNYDVAVKALQRAIDLDPLDERTKKMLDRARVRRSLDPPAPIPGETQPLGGTMDSEPHLVDTDLALQGAPPETFDDGPTTVGQAPPDSIDEAPTTVEIIERAENVPQFVLQPKATNPEPKPLTPKKGTAVPVARPAAAPRPAPRATAPAPAVVPAATPPEPIPVPQVAEPSSSGPSPTAHHRQRKSTQRPVHREHHHEKLAQAPGAEEFLNGLLGARAAHWPKDLGADDDGLPVEQWGRRLRRPFLWMWLALFTVTAAGASWYLAGIWVRDRAVKRHLAAAHADLIEMSASSLGAAEDEATLAIARNPASVESVAMLANARAFALLVYGDGQGSDVETVIVAARQRLKDEKATPDGRRELLLARAAFALAVQNRGADVAAELTAVRGELDQALVDWPREPLVYWLNGLARLANGDRGGAREALRQAQTLGLAAARVTLADMDLDEGNAVAAVAGYEETLKTAPAHSLALAGRALARAETASDAEAVAALRELEPTLTRVDGKRAEAWARLAVSRLCGRAGDRERARTELDAAVATGSTDARFLARAALALLDQGDVERAYTTRTRVRSRAADPLLPVIDAELLLAGGRPDEAIRTVGATEDARAKLVRGRALIDVGRAGDAITQLEEAARRPATAGAGAAWLAFARLATTPGLGPLGKLADAPTPSAPLARGLLGEARFKAGDLSGAQKDLEQALTDNPLAYRAAGLLALVALQQGKLADAESQARGALSYAPGYLPAHAALGRALVVLGRQSEAAPELKLVVEAGVASGADELAYAEASLAQGEPDVAREALARAAQKGVSPEALARVTALVDPGAAPAVNKAPPPKTKPQKGKRGRRGR